MLSSSIIVIASDSIYLGLSSRHLQIFVSFAKYSNYKDERKSLPSDFVVAIPTMVAKRSFVVIQVSVNALQSFETSVLLNKRGLYEKPLRSQR